MDLHYIDPFKLTLKEVEDVIVNYNLQAKLSDLLAEISRMDYNGYIKLSKPREKYSCNDWENVLQNLQSSIMHARNQNESIPLPEFMEKKLQRILQKADYPDFKRFVTINADYLPDELSQERDNEQFLRWIFARLQEKIIVLFQNQIRLGTHVDPEDLK